MSRDMKQPNVLAARPSPRPSPKGRGGSRSGAIFTLELLLVLPILLIVVLALVELSLLLMGMQRVQAASSAACQVATLPASDPVALQGAMDDAAEGALATEGLVTSYEMQSLVGPYSGDPVTVEISAPMTAAAPDLLRMIGFSLQGRRLVARTQMCKQ